MKAFGEKHGPSQRVAGELAQYACAMTGFALQCAWMGDDICVVVFGERDCLNTFPRLSLSFGSKRRWTFFCANLSESDIIAGQAEARLEECLRAVTTFAKPILVLSTCVTEMIGADPLPVCQKISEETGVKVLPVRTSGLVPRTQAAIMDWFAEVMWREFGAHGPPEPKAINLIGYDTYRPPDPRFERLAFRHEVQSVLKQFGLTLNATVPAGGRLRDWEALPKAGLTLVAERALYERLCSLIESGERKIVEVAPPVGLRRSDQFYGALAHYAGLSNAVLESLPGRAEAEAALERARKAFSGRRLAYGLGSHHNFEGPQMVYDGLGDLAIFQEMGFEVVLVIQERDKPEVHARIRKNLEALGISLPYQLFYEPATLAPILKESGAEIAYLSDFLGGEAHKARIPMVRLGGIRSGYGGVAEAVDMVEAALEGGFEARYEKYLK